MSMKYLGESYDIHTSSRELVFPHHENELAIAKALTGKPLARFWIHCGQVVMENREDGQEKPTLPTLNELIMEGFTPREIRFWLISNHYRKPVSFSRSRLKIQTRRALKRIDTCIHALMAISEGSDYVEIDQLVYDIRQVFVSAMDDDLNFPRALSAFFNIIKKINILIKNQDLSGDNAAALLAAFREVDAVIRIFDFDPPELDPALRELLETREIARKEGDFETADRIRNQLRAQGVNVRDARENRHW
jgi:cysteinyl-tRNA synthetase